jgi:hypothetical protein
MQGDYFAASQAQTTPARCQIASLQFVVVGEAPGFIAMGQARKVFAVGYSCPSPGIALVA